MAAASVGSFFKSFFSLILLLIHLGCFNFAMKRRFESPKLKKPKKVTPTLSSACPSPHTHPHRPHKSPKSVISASLSSILRRMLPSNDVTSPKRGSITTISESSSSSSSQQYCSRTAPGLSARSSQVTAVTPIVLPKALIPDSPLDRRHPNGAVSRLEADISSDNRFFALRNDIFPCPACGEIFHNPQVLDQHQSIKHAVSELRDGDSGRNVIQIIFRTAWTESTGGGRSPNIHRILKIHNRPKILARFEEYRERVKLRAARAGGGVVRRRDERCLADGNELLRFHCATFVCGLGEGGGSGACNHAYCGACGIIRAGFSPKMDGISTMSSSWRAHVAIPEDMEEEFAFMNVKRAMLVCRVIAGRVGRDPVDELDKAGDEEGGFDSVVSRDCGPHHRLGDEELVVFNPWAVLPCFVIVYSV